MKKYSTPQLEIISQNSDIILASLGNADNDSTDIYGDDILG